MKIDYDKSKLINPDAPLTMQDREKFQQLYSMFTNQGWLTVNDEGAIKYGKFHYEDITKENDILRFIPKIVTHFLRGSLQPSLVLSSNLFTTIRMDRTISVNVGAFGPIEVKEIGESGEYPETHINFDGGEETQPVSFKKIGAQLVMSEEAMELGYDIVRIFVSEAGKALARYKEKFAADVLSQTGVSVFDNYSPTTAFFGNTTGRNITGSENGTFSQNDIIKLYSFMQMRGFNPDSMVMNPMAWMTLATSPDTREIVTNGNVVTSQPTPDGDRSAGFDNPFSPFGLNTKSGTGTQDPDGVIGKIGYNPWVNTLNPLSSTFNVKSKYLPTPMKMIISPFVRYNQVQGSVAANTGIPATDIIMADSSATGIIFQNKTPAMRDYKDFLSDATYIRIFERYGMDVIYQGKGIGLAKNVVIDRNYVFDNVNSQTIAKLGTDTQLVG